MCDVCSGETLEQVLARYQRMVDEHGWTVISVECGGRSAPGFSYTVGLHRFGGQPELLISGCDPGIPEVLNGLGDHVADGERFAPGDVGPDCVPVEVRMAEVADPRRLQIAQALLGDLDLLVPALQVVRRDRRGLWPWEPGWSVPGEEYFGRPLPHPRSGGPRAPGAGQRPQPRRRGRR